MKLKKKQLRAIHAIVAIASLALGIFVFIAAFLFKEDNEYDEMFLGWVILCTSVIDFSLTLLEKHKNTLDYVNLLMEFSSFVLSIFYFTLELNHFDIKILLTLWGGLEACDGLFEVTNRYTHSNKKHISTYFLCGLFLVKITFGILLCIELSEGLFLHLIITGLVFTFLPLMHQWHARKGHQTLL